MNVVEIKNLSFSYGRKNVINNLSLSVPQGAIYGLIGQNGAGKSTLLQIILRLLNAPNNSVYAFGKDINEAKHEILARMGSVIESPSFYENLSAIDNLQYLSILFRKNISQENMVLMKNIDLNSRTKVKHFSTGMKQRLAIVMALFNNPDLLILDEPLNGLDIEGVIELREFLMYLNSLGKTIILSSHILAELEKICTHVGILEEGKLLFEGTINTFLAKSVKNIFLRLSTPDKALKVLQNHYSNISLNNEFIMLTNSKQQDLNSIINILVKNNVEILDIFSTPPSLESAYINLTKQS